LLIEFDKAKRDITLFASGKGWQTRLGKHIKEAVLKGTL
jgi:uncharacterized protein (DUF4415 family)